MGLLFTPARNKYIVMGEKRGFARGIAIGEARVATRFAAWFARKAQAESAGRPFTEPPPFLTTTESADNHNPPNPNRQTPNPPCNPTNNPPTSLDETR